MCDAGTPGQLHESCGKADRHVPESYTWASSEVGPTLRPLIPNGPRWRLRPDQLHDRIPSPGATKNNEWTPDAEAPPPMLMPRARRPTSSSRRRVGPARSHAPMLPGERSAEEHSDIPRALRGLPSVLGESSGCYTLCVRGAAPRCTRMRGLGGWVAPESRPRSGPASLRNGASALWFWKKVGTPSWRDEKDTPGPPQPKNSGTSEIRDIPPKYEVTKTPDRKSLVRPEQLQSCTNRASGPKAGKFLTVRDLGARPPSDECRTVFKALRHNARSPRHGTRVSTTWPDLGRERSGRLLYRALSRCGVNTSSLCGNRKVRSFVPSK